MKLGWHLLLKLSGSSLDGEMKYNVIKRYSKVIIMTCQAESTSLHPDRSRTGVL